MAEIGKEIIENEVLFYSKNKEEKLPFEFCKKLLNTNGIEYTDEEATKIVEYLYQMAAIHLQQIELSKASLLKLIKTDTQDEESHSLYPSEYRRAG